MGISEMGNNNSTEFQQNLISARKSKERTT
jgi:hypothetical protein